MSDTRAASRALVWLAWRDTAAIGPQILEQARAWLTAAETERVDRLVRSVDRANTLVGRWLARRLLAAAVPGTAPADWWFSAGPHGRPEPHCPLPAVVPSVNVSHTGSVVVVALSERGSVGVDVERSTRRAAFGVARRWFSPRELEALEQLEAEERAQRFWRLWTLKEAWLKARGTGITGSLASATFDLDPPCLLAARDDDPAAWRFAEPELLADHRVAVALRAPGSAELACETLALE